MEKNVRIGIIGLGGMGASHASYIAKGEVRGAQLTAVCDAFADKREWVKANLGSTVQFYDNREAMLASGDIDAVIVATPHFDHPESAVEAFQHGLHVMIEKPAGVYTRQVQEMNEVAKKSGKVFGIMFNLRSDPVFQKLRDLVSSRELGDIRRTNWIITSWYRSQAYYDSGGWRGTWAGEGGGVLLNQCPHNLDLWGWTIGLAPKRVRAFCAFGKHRNIEVEDEVTAYVEYDNGATGLFITSTSEATGTNRFEVIGDKGKVVIEDGKLSFWRLRVGQAEFNRENKAVWGKPEIWKCEVSIDGPAAQHKTITQNWVDAILHGKPLLSPGEEGLDSLMLSNAMYLSTWTDGWVDLPIDENLYYDKLQEQVRSSAFRK